MTANDQLLLRNVHAGLRGPLRDVRITGGRVAAVAGRLDPVAGEEVVDADGRTLLPGLHDAHVHAVHWAVSRRRLDVSAARSASQAVELVARQLDVESAGGAVTIGYGFRDAFWTDRPHKSLLEAAAPGHAIVLHAADLHTSWFSPAALALVGRGDHPTGVLHEQDAYAATAAIPQASEEEVDRWVAEAMTAAAARGVTGILDFEYADTLTDWRRRLDRHPLDVRVVCSVPRYLLEEAIARGVRTGQPVAGGDGLLEVGPVKLFVDGSLNTRTAYCASPYPTTPGGPETRGRLETPLEELEGVMARAAAGGLHPAVHAIGDLAVAIALDAFEAVGCPGRIEHAQLLRPEDLPRFARPGLVAGVQPAHGPDDRDIAEALWSGRTERAFAYADLLAAGATIQLGSDAPVAPLDPWDGIAAAVTRTDDARPPWHPEQAIDLPVALAAASRGRTGVTPGDPADLVVVDQDPAALPPERLGTGVEVFGTLLAGRWTHRSW